MDPLNYVDQPAGFPAECFKVPRLSVNLKERDVVRGKSVRSWCDGSSDRSFIVDPLNYVDQPAGFPAECFKVPRLSVNLKERDVVRGKSVRSWCDGSSDRSFIVDPLNYVHRERNILDLPAGFSAECFKVSRLSRKEENVLFNDAPNTFYLRLYGVGHMVKDHSYIEEIRCRHYMVYSFRLAARGILYAPRGILYLNTICLTPNNRFYFCAGVSLNIHTFIV